MFALTIWCIEAAVLVQWGPCKPATAFIAEKTSIFKVWQKSAFYFWWVLLNFMNFMVLESRNDKGTFSGATTCLFFCTASATANLFGFFLTLVGSGSYGYAVFKHKRAVS